MASAKPLVGEGCPGAVATKARETRQGIKDLGASSCRWMLENAGACQRSWHTTDTARDGRARSGERRRGGGLASD